MVTQNRAARTREALIRAAAADVDANGYHGATMSSISASARVSMGALTFHFSSKRALAETVVEEASTITRARAATAVAGYASPLSAVFALMRGLAGLLDEDVVVRAAALLARERPKPVPGWHDAWVPVLNGLLREADKAGELRQDARPDAVTALVVYVLTAVEAYRCSPVGEGLGAQAALERLWPFVWRGVTVATA
ncbi:TetR/AcrR family transcriptional regulator [Streptomyces sp. NPDC059900]|uniref:TetR/AcrR family transcriptional regulator n=1 Tax=Streptomyces sp. NPDC059900 TaxID=3155816 RepID=UPI00342E5261